MAGTVSNRATRAASIGLACVVLSFAVFTIVAAYTTQTQVERAQQLAVLHDAYEHATTAIRAEETAELEYLLDPSLEHGAELTVANGELIEAIGAITAQGDETDAQVARDIQALHEQYFAASERLAGAMAAGNVAEARRIDEDVADPIFHAMHDLITAATLERATQDAAAFAVLNSTARWMLVLAPVVFAIGFVLLLGLWRVLDQYDRARRRTYREIEQLSRLRGEFVAIVSHEFRTPLTGIQGFSEMMRDEQLTTAEMQEYAADINKDARRLTRLINDMLDLDQMESGQMMLNLAPVDLNRIVADAAAQFRSGPGDTPVALDLDAQLPTMLSDSDRLTQIVTNLLGNAVKYSPRGGAVEVRTGREGRMVTLTVSDHGIGIAAERLETIFERYSGVETTATTSLQGAGLGLPIVRHIVELLAGTVWATSESGKGAVIHVRLPLEVAAPARRAA